MVNSSLSTARRLDDNIMLVMVEVPVVVVLSIDYSVKTSLMYHKLYCQITQNSHISDLEYNIHIHINVIRNIYINTQMT